MRVVRRFALPEPTAKVLPEALAHDPDRLARFEREAKTLASLNHPNIAQIYGLEKGPAEAGPYVREKNPPGVVAGFSRPVYALVLELVEGRTLADRIAMPGPRDAAPDAAPGLRTDVGRVGRGGPAELLERAGSATAGSAPPRDPAYVERERT